MSEKSDNLEKLVFAGKNPIEAARERAAGRRAVGCVLTDVPFELVHAAGFYPVAILGHRGPAGKGREHLQSFCCSYARSVLDLLLGDTLGFLEGAVIPFVCDTTRAIDYTLRHTNNLKYLECYRPPKSMSGRGVKEYLTGEIVRIEESLEKRAGTKISDAKFAETVKTYNAARAELRKFVPLRKTDPDTFYAVCRAFMVLPVEEFIALAKSTEVSASASSKKKIPILVAGKVMEPGDLAKTLSDVGAQIVADDLVTGSRLFALDLDEKKNPIDAIVERQLGNIPFVGFAHTAEDRSDYLVKLAKSSGAAGAILIAQKFCEPFEIDIPEIRDRFKRENIPALVIETDYEPAVSGALKTRIQAFLEMIGNG